MFVVDDSSQMNMQGDLNAVIVVTEATQCVKVHTWAVNGTQSSSADIITHATNIDSFYQPVRFLLPIRESDTFAIFYERTVHMVLLS